MIKSIKSILLTFVIAFVASIILPSNVFAYELGEIGSHKITSDKIPNDSCVSNKSCRLEYFRHGMVYNGTQFSAYCLDGLKHSGDHDAQFKIIDILNPDNAKDAVILYIINDQESSYDSKLIALRAFLPFTYYFKNSPVMSSDWNPDTADTRGIYAIYNSGLLWAAEHDQDTRDLLGIDKDGDIISDDLYERFMRPRGLAGYTFSGDRTNYLSTSDATVAGAKDLFVRAYAYGANVARGEKTTKKAVVFSEPKVDETKTVYENDRVKKDINLTVTFNGLNDGKTTPINLNINADENGFARVDSMEYQVVGTDSWVAFNNSTDLRSLITEESVSLNVRVHASAPTATTSKPVIKFTVKATYEDGETLRGALFSAVNIPDNYQRFFIGDRDTSSNMTEDSATFDLTWKDTPGRCENIVPNKANKDEFKEYINTCCRGNNEDGFNIVDECTKATNNKDQKGIDTWCKLQHEYCDYCNTSIEVPKTCAEFSEGKFEEDKKAKINGPEDVYVCVIDGEDENHNSYQLTKDETTKENSYCNVFCKEDYSMTLPAGRYVTSGRYFTLQMQIKGTKSCYTDRIDQVKFNQDITTYESQLNGYIASGNTSSKEFTNLYNKYNKAISDMNACAAGWSNSYDFNPDISFDYDEEYINMLGANKLKFEKATETEKSNVSNWFCNGETSDYKTCQGASSSTNPTRTMSRIECTNGTCSRKDIQITTATYASKTVENNADFVPMSQFYTKYSTGVINHKNNIPCTANQIAKGECKYTSLEEKLNSLIPDEYKQITAGELPVSLKDGRGVYNYDMYFSNIGEFYDKDKSGRLVDKNEKNEPVAITKDNTTFKGTYVCSYVVNCPECKVTCVDEPEKGFFCSIPDIKDNGNTCVGDECEIECAGTCAFDNDLGELFTVHQTSITNINPTDRQLGANLTNEKGQYTLNAIEGLGESIYDKAEYSFEFTPAAISYLRDYNRSAKGGYLDDSMSCKYYSQILKQDKTSTKEEIQKAEANDYLVCTSNVLDTLTNGSYQVHAQLDGRDKIKGWLNSDYCKKDAKCAIVGTVGPAWK